MFEHFYVILWIYTQNQSHRSGTTSLLRQREAGGLWTHLCCWAQTVLQLRPPRLELELDLARTEPSVPIPACIQSCWESPSHHFIVFVPFPPPLAEMFWLAVLQSLWVFPPAVSPVCCLIPGGACWFLGLVCSRGIALPAPGQDGLAVCSAPAWCVQLRVTELWILAVFMYSHNGESLG